MPETLADFPFMYLYFRLDAAAAPFYRSSEKGQVVANLPVPENFVPVVARLRAFVQSSSFNGDGIIEFEGLRCRLSRQAMADGQQWLCARRMPFKIPALSELGYTPHIVNHLRSLGKRSGLILLSGMAGQGKTTTAAALLVDFLSSYGGTAITVENPIEYDLKGRHGSNGQCFQIQPASSDDWVASLERTLSWAPNYVFAGKIHNPKVAEILLRAATTGHTIITTVEAGAPEDALIEVLYLAEQAMGPSAANILAQGMTALLFQTMKNEGPFIRYLFTEENAPGDPIRTLIREGKVTMISTYIDRIAARLSNTPPSLPSISGKNLPPLPGQGPLPPIKKN